MWVLIAIAVIIIIFLITNRKEQEEDLPNYPIRHADITFFWNGRDLFNQYFEDIRNAKQFICINFFIVKKDQFGQEFIQLMKEKADEGVAVYLIVDRIGSRALSKEIRKNLKVSGVHFSFSNKISFKNFFHSVNHRNHRKITVIDGTAAYVGGFNVGNQYVNGSSKFSLWRDYHLRLTGGIVKDVLDLFKRDWVRNNGVLLPVSTQSNIKGASKTQLRPTSHGSLEGSFYDLINRAQSQIKIGSPYFIPNEALITLLEEKAKQGVQIDVLYPHESDHPFVKEASIPYLKRMEQAGANVHLFNNGFYHAKLLLIDDYVIDIGTANFDRRSIYLNDEVNVLIYDEEVIKRINSYYEQDVKDSVGLYKEWLEQPNRFVMAINKAIAYIFRPLL
ncbi:cardiolipin synthase [Alkalibacillus filiformis]|uniref:Cardiolipin synthase n=1 Tax=Alkalibacillus filiformis TaxID=200990 RepID=A0ABU0DWR2_9BACI|nr:phospholipase D-like domain-containing protein [Alkalibacillus filiformis]MDQ0352600.1 cardiolipin synthase [Alkalibacillus filiformis]